MRRLAKAALFIATVMLAARALGQQSVPNGMTLSQIVATVRDSAGKLVRGLRPDDFLLEANGRSARIVSIDDEPKVPISIGFLVDRLGLLGGSPYTPLETEIGALRVLLHVAAMQGDEIQVMELLRTFRVVEPFSESHEKVDSALAALYPVDVNRLLHSNRELDVRGQLERALREMKNARNARRAIVLATGGEGQFRLRDVASLEVKAFEIPVYVICAYDMLAANYPGTLRAANLEAEYTRMNEEFAAATGGRSIHIRARLTDNVVEKISEFSREIAADLRGQYMLGFYAETGTEVEQQALRLRTKVAEHRVQFRRFREQENGQR